mgnify:CR=1 FL=1
MIPDPWLTPTEDPELSPIPDANDATIARLRQRLARPPAAAGGDLDAEPIGGWCLAAVLVPLVRRHDALTVLLTLRAPHLLHHPGQVSFPGGRVEASDRSPPDTALRETEEEIGLARERIEVLGQLPRYHTVSGFAITPVVGLVTPPFELSVDSLEVADVFEVPLPFLLDARNRERRAIDYQGQRREYQATVYQGRVIWGATAGILASLGVHGF